MDEPQESEIAFQLRKLYNFSSDDIDAHRWPDEGARWNELIVSLLARIAPEFEDGIRTTVETLDGLGLLDVDLLATIPETNGGVELNSVHAKRIVGILSELGFDVEESADSLLAMHELSKSLVKNYRGKIQGYLRKYGSSMIAELDQNFTFSKLSQEDREYAFAIWLQNVLNMPISLQDESVKKFCEELGGSPRELEEEADKLNLNLALVDDLIINWESGKNTQDSSPKKESEVPIQEAIAKQDTPAITVLSGHPCRRCGNWIQTGTKFCPDCAEPQV